MTDAHLRGRRDVAPAGTADQAVVAFIALLERLALPRPRRRPIRREADRRTGVGGSP